MNKNKENLIYLAGFIDGEGCISEIHRWHRPLSSKRFEIRISNTDLGVLEWIKQEYGGYLYKMSDAIGNHKVCYQWYISDKRAKELYKLLKPYLKIKNQL